MEFTPENKSMNDVFFIEQNFLQKKMSAELKCMPDDIAENFWCKLILLNEW